MRPIQTGPDGTFRTPKELDREDREYQAEISADGYQPGRRRPWSTTGEGDVLTFPDVTLRRSHGAPGRLGPGRRPRGPAGGRARRSSRPGDGPRRTEATTDGDGRFRLAGVYAGPALVFAEAAGFRFGGAVVGPGPGPVEVRLAREGEPPIADARRRCPRR